MNRTSPGSAILAALLLGVAFAVAAVAPLAMAASTDDGSVTWSVSPADANGADGRVRIETSLDPGETMVEHLVVKNLSATEVTFAIQAADGYRTPTGRFNMLASDQESVDAGTWVEAPENVVLAANESAVVEFTITVPANATPGDHLAGIAATIQSVGTGADGNSLTVESRVGFPILLRVNGELAPSLVLTPVSTSYEFSWNPFAPGRVTAVYEISNDGNVRMQAAPTVEAQGRTNVVDPEAPPITLSPGDTRKITTTISGVWPLFFAPVHVTLDTAIVSTDGNPQPADPLIADTSVLAIPVPQLLVLLGVALVIVALVIGRRRSQLQMAAMLEEARAAGRREVEQ